MSDFLFLFPNQSGLDVGTLEIVEQKVIVNLAVNDTQAKCPVCNAVSTKVHSHYQRKMKDLNWANYIIELSLTLRRFRCCNPECTRRIFCERVTQLAPAYARRTSRFSQRLVELALALGGRPAVRLALKLKLETSRSTLLRVLSQQSLPTYPTPRVLGVDDFALRKGNTYGTILVDLEKHRPVELLEDRTSATLATWLKAHPGVEIVSRDGSRTYAEGINEGTLKAVQVSDRFHLLKGLTKAVHSFFQRKRIWQQSFEVLTRGGSSPELKDINTKNTELNMPLQAQELPVFTPQELARLSKHQQRQYHKHQYRLERYRMVNELDQQGKGKREIARELGMAFETVVKYLKAATPEIVAPMPRQPRASMLDPYKEYVWKRWSEERLTVLQLHAELQARGYTGSVAPIRSFLAQLRPYPHWGSGPHKVRPNLDKQALAVKVSNRKLSGREATWLILKKKRDLSLEQQELLKQVLVWDAQVQVLYKLVQAFTRMVSFKQSEKLEKWLIRVKQSGIEELQSYARGIEADLAAVKAGLSLEYSNGQLEGQVNRLKTIKKQMYGRASFKLLRQRVLLAA